MARDHDGQLQIIGVAGLDSADRMAAFVDTHDLHHVPHAMTEDGALWVDFDISYQPAWIILDADGEVVLRGVRPSFDEVLATLDDVATP